MQTVEYSGETYIVFQAPIKKGDKTSAVVSDSRNKPYMMYLDSNGYVQSVVPIIGFDDVTDVLTYFRV